MLNHQPDGKNEFEPGGDKLAPLLEERARLKDRLRLIDSKRAEVSEEVFLRVKSDYESRLEYLNREIGRQARVLETTLRNYRELVGLLGRGLDLGSQSLDELKVRCALGEYDREEFENIGREKKAKVEYYQGKIESYRANIERIESVLTQIGAA